MATARGRSNGSERKSEKAPNEGAFGIMDFLVVSSHLLTFSLFHVYTWNVPFVWPGK
jgi:hypothetical protein